ncbi:MAG: hypothetical protein IKU37_09070 [Candidatus Gastranaerophilales bacterium]|nr:hypothetical protein [Candidatus Gastranaerophilales bacterium]
MIKGIDLSEWQENIDYAELKRNGIDFALIRCGYGKDAGQKDSMFETHYKGCKEAGIKVGAYHFSYCTCVENAKFEAQNCLDYIRGKDFDLPIYYDLENDKTIGQLSEDEITQIALIFCRNLESEGYRAGVYANLNWFRNKIRPQALELEGYSIWLAQWNDEITADFEVDIWQYTNNIFNTESNRIDGNYLLNTNLIDIEPTPEFEVDICKSLAVDVIFGKYGNGEERKEALGNYYEEVQDIVNEIYNTICV